MDFFLYAFATMATATATKIDKNTPIKIKSNKLFTLNDKPWISRAIKRSVEITNKIYKQYCKEKDQLKKELFMKQFKTHSYNIAVLTRINREDFYIKKNLEFH